MTDYATRRIMMVDAQVRPSDVTKFPIIEAMLRIPREVFVPAAHRDVAYVGEHILLAPGRVVLDARTLAKMLDALDIQPGDLVLDVGAGLGYSSAVIARLAEAVVAVEDDAERAAEAQANLAAESADNVAVIAGPLEAGAPRHGPYDVITVEGGIEVLPEALADQLKDGGRIGCIFMQGALGQFRIGYKSGGHISWRREFDATAPVLPGFAARPAFAL